MFANTAAGGGGTSVGIGTSVSTVLQTFSQGNIEVTSNPLDLAINGQGFYRMSTNGTITYSRRVNGQFQLDKNGYIVNSQGQNLTGYPASSNGTGVTTASPTNLQVSNADRAPNASNVGRPWANFDSRSTALMAAGFNMTNPATYHGATSSVYDTAGQSRIPCRCTSSRPQPTTGACSRRTTARRSALARSARSASPPQARCLRHPRFPSTCP